MNSCPTPFDPARRQSHRTGFCWAALTNTRTEPSDEIGGALDQMVWDMVHQVPSWAA